MAPPTCRINEFRPVASAILCRGMFDSATVVSGTNRQAKATPWTASGMVMLRVPESSVRWLSCHELNTKSSTPSAITSRGDTTL